MENSVDNITTESAQPRILELDYVQGLLTTTSRWSKFLGIIGFIACGFVVIGALSLFALGNNLSNMEGMPYSTFMSGGILGSIYLLAGLLYFFPSLYLYQYAEKLQNAVRSQDENQLVLALAKNKAFFRFVGIMVVVTLIMYFLMFIGLMAGFGANLVSP